MESKTHRRCTVEEQKKHDKEHPETLKKIRIEHFKVLKKVKQSFCQEPRVMYVDKGN